MVSPPTTQNIAFNELKHGISNTIGSKLLHEFIKSLKCDIKLLDCWEIKNKNLKQN